MEFRVKNYLSRLNSIYLIVFLFYVSASIIGMISHEMWRDELQAWMVARDANGLIELFKNVKYEGNPALWHILLFILSRFADSPYIMMVLHLAISFSFVALFLFRSDFSFLNKILFVSGYFILFEYNLISRGYGLGVLLVFIIIVLSKNFSKHKFWIFFLAALLSNTTVYGLIISGAFVFLFLFNSFTAEKKIQNIKGKKKVHDIHKLTFSALKFDVRLIVGLLIYLIGVVLSIIQIYPEPDNSFPVHYPEPFFDLERMRYISEKLMNAFIAIPDFSGIHFWNNDLISWNLFEFTPVVFLLLILLSIVSLISNRQALIFYTLSTSVLLFMYYYSLLTWWRYTGHLFIVLIAAYWIKDQYSETKYFRARVNKIKNFGKKISPSFLTIILLLHSIGGITAIIKDYKYEFSASESAVQFLKMNKLDHLPVVAETDFIVSTISGLLNKPLFYPSIQGYGSFIIYDQQRKLNVKKSDIVKAIENVSKNSGDSLLLITGSSPLTNFETNEIYSEGWFNENLTYKLIKSFDRSIIVDDELLHIYVLEKKNYYSIN